MAFQNIHCGVEDSRWISTGDTTETALEWSMAGPDTLARDVEFGGKQHPMMKEVVMGIGDSYWCHACNMMNTCVCTSDKPV